MPKNILLPLALGATLLTGALTPSSVAPETQLKDSEHKKVGAMIGECITAYVERDGRREAELELNEYLDKKWTKAAKGRSPLALTDDLSAALWYSEDYSKAKVRKGRIDDMEVDVEFHGDHKITNAVWTPNKYSAKQKYPLILCVPEAGEEPEAHLNDHWALQALRDTAIIVALDMPENTEYWGGLGERGDSEKVGGISVLLTTYAELRRSYAIDFDKVFLAGRGEGVAAAMQMANASPDRFCGVIGRSGDAAEIQADNLSNLPMLLAGAGSRAETYSEAAKAEGYADCTLVPEAKIEDIASWITETTRRSNPEQVVLIPGEVLPLKAYWIEVPRKEYTADARLVATVDRSSNTVTVEAKGVTDVTLYFNDVMLDLEQPIKVICNGAETVNTIPRNFNTLMSLVYKARNEPGKLYTASREYTIAAD